MNLAGFRIEGVIEEGATVRVHVGRRLDGDVPVILKELREDHVSPQAIERLYHEHDIIREHCADCMPRAITVERYQNTFVSVFEDAGGRSLLNLLGIRKPELTEALKIAVATTAALSDLHSVGVLHRSIRPGHVVYNEAGASAWFSGFGFSRHQRDAGCHEPIETYATGHLRYMAPELTGRVDRRVDSRTDLYALGATFYRLFTGQPPFYRQSDSLEVLHSVIARPPEAPDHICADLPAAIADIILKLMAKSPDDRYQTVQGLQADLDDCLSRIHDDPTLRGFRVGRYDHASRLQIGQTLYGRERELSAIHQAFARTVEGERGMVLVSGYSGIGKTSLITTVHPELTWRGAFWGAGKFDQLRRDVPYSALVNALQKVVLGLLARSNAVIEYWQHEIETALGANTRVITDAIPELALITGQQPALPTLPSLETKNRFIQAFMVFVRVFCNRDHPLVLFIDDLQWVDLESLSLIEAMVTNPALGHLLIIGAYRDNEVDDQHPLAVALDDMRAAGCDVQEVHLAPLTREHVTDMLRDVLSAERSQVAQLTDVLQSRAQGNPFAIAQFLKALQSKGLLTYSTAERHWQWDIAQVRAQPMPDDIVDLILEDIRNLPANSQRVLECGACIGGLFDLSLVARAIDLSTDEAIAAVFHPVEVGLLYPVNPADENVGLASGLLYAFAHDRIQQAAYVALGDNERQLLHLGIGHLLLEQTGDLDERRFEALSHINRCLNLIETAQQRVEFAQMNLGVGCKALGSGASQTAFYFFNSGVALLGETGWQDHYELRLGLTVEAAGAAHLAGFLDVLEQLIHDVKENVAEPLEKIRVYEIEITAAIEKNELTRAISTAYSALRLLGVRIPTRPKRHHTVWRLLKTKLMLRGKSIEGLMDLPAMTDPVQLAKMRIYTRLATVAYWTDPDLIPLVVLDQLRVTLRYGNSEQSPMAFASYGMILCAVLNDMKDGVRFGNLAIALIDRYPLKEERPRVLVTATAFTTSFNRHVGTTFKPLIEAYETGCDGSNLQFGCYGAWTYCIYSFQSGKELNTLAREMRKYSDAMLTMNQVTTYYGNELYHQTVLNLLGEADDPCSLVGERYNEDHMLAVHDQAADGTERFVLFANKTFLNFLFGRYETAVGMADQCQPYLDNALGSFSVPVFFLHEALASLALYAERRSNGTVQSALYRRAVKNERRLRRYAQHAPANHRHKYLLLKAERLRLNTRTWPQAESLYHHAISGARANGFVQDEAMAFELAARHFAYAHDQQDGVANVFLMQAHATYAKWGAVAKVRMLEAQHPEILRAVKKEPARGAMVVDFHALKKSLGVLAQEKVHSRIIEKTLLTATEFAGAETGILLLPSGSDGELFVEGEHCVGDGRTTLMHSLPAGECERMSLPVMQLVQRSRKSLVIQDAQLPQNELPELYQDDNIQRRRVRSILCMPIQVAADASTPISALLYLENNLAPGVFTEERVEVLEVIGLTVATSIELSQQAATDGLTGVYNHRFFMDHLETEANQSQRYHRALSLIMLDIDSFKAFNDQWGHQVGDEVLAGVAGVVKEQSRGADLVARYGGEEFAVVLAETDIEGARQSAEQIRQAVGQAQFYINERAFRVTVSVGVAALGGRTGAQALIRAADTALYRAKETGRNCVCIAEEAWHKGPTS